MSKQNVINSEINNSSFLEEKLKDGSTSLVGTVESRVFYNEDNFFTILKIKVRGNKELITVLGTSHAINVGENIEVCGHWITDKKFGLQFRADTIKSMLPTNETGIERYLSSSAIRGIGPQTAKKIVQRFGMDTIEILENDPDKLMEIQGIGKNKLLVIAKSWQENRLIKDIMIFLHSYGISQNLAYKIFRKYGKDSIHIAQTKPYQLVDIPGISFITADSIALKMGLPQDSPSRIAACIEYLLIDAAASNGSSCMPYNELMSKACQLTNCSSEQATTNIEAAVAQNKICYLSSREAAPHIVCNSNLLGTTGEDAAVNHEIFVALSIYKFMETQISRKIQELQRQPSRLDEKIIIFYDYFRDKLIANEEYLNSAANETAEAHKNGSVPPNNQDSSPANNIVPIESDKSEIIEKNKDFSQKCESLMKWFLKNNKIYLSNGQRQAIQTILANKITIVTGGPGTGKTTLISSLLRLIKQLFSTQISFVTTSSSDLEAQLENHKSNLGSEDSATLNFNPLAGTAFKIRLAAPTGRAAKRMSESTRHFATTIHRLLEMEPSSFDFKYNENHKLDCDLLIIDESSMLDTHLMLAIIKAVPAKTKLVFVGDVDQIPSVGPGQILNDLIQSMVLPVVSLSKVFRQAAHSQIIINSHLINRGYLPSFADASDNQSDCVFLDLPSNDDLNASLSGLLNSERLLDFLKQNNLDRLQDVQILVPMHKGNAGVRALNPLLQQLLNPKFKEQHIEKFGRLYALGDKVMQTENNYNKHVFNGDIGFIREINNENSELIVTFDDKETEYSFQELDQLTHAYAITIHKSQGSEYPVVIIPILTQHFIMLNKNLVYTALTRAKKLAFFLGHKKALAIAVKNQSKAPRYSMLKYWLRHFFE